METLTLPLVYKLYVAAWVGPLSAEDSAHSS